MMAYIKHNWSIRIVSSWENKRSEQDLGLRLTSPFHDDPVEETSYLKFIVTG